MEKRLNKENRTDFTWIIILKGDVGVKKEKVFSFCSQFSLLLLCMLMADCCIAGAGRIIMIGPVSFRMLAFALLLVTSIPLVIDNFKKLMGIPEFIAVIFFFVWLVIEIIIGALINKNPLHVLFSDVKGFSYFIAAPAMICILNTKERIHIIMKVMMYASGVLGIVAIIHLIHFIWFKESFEPVYLWGLNAQFSALSTISPTMPRLFFKSSVYLLVGCAFPLYFQIVSERIKNTYFLIVGINMFSILLTYTRSIYLGAGVTVLVLLVCYLVFCPAKSKKCFGKCILASLLSFLIVTTSFCIAAKTDYFSFAITRTLLSFSTNSDSDDLSSSESSDDSQIISTPSEEASKVHLGVSESSVESPEDNEQLTGEDSYKLATQKSDVLREDISKDLILMIANSPVMGNGLGATLEWREYNEYFYLELMAKTGIIGLLLYMAPMLLSVYRVLKQRKKRWRNKVLSFTWLSVLLGFMAFSYFNPYMNAALGVLFYCCFIAAINTAICDNEFENL